LALAGGLALATAAHAAVFVVDDTESSHLKLTKAKDAASSTGTVFTPNDVNIAVVGNADFADGFSTIKPVKGGSLTELTFTPANPNAFSDFTFRGQSIDAQNVELIVTDNQGDAPQDFFFDFTKSNEDFGPFGITAANPHLDSIKSIELIDTGGFEEAKQFTFSPSSLGKGGGGGVPEPASWATMLMGLGAVGAVLRKARRAVLAT
jgi:hypothetical protein